MHMSIEQTGVRTQGRRLEGYAHAALHAEPAFALIATLIAARNAAAWRRTKRNAPSTLAAKTSNEPLVDSGGLKKDLTDATRGTLKINDDELVFGSLRWYGKFSQGGTKHEPRRRPLKFTPRTRQESVDLIRSHIMLDL